MERMREIESPSQPWQGHILTTKLHPHYIITSLQHCIILILQNKRYIYIVSYFFKVARENCKNCKKIAIN